jgi:SAM-dependent methyltransferase
MDGSPEDSLERWVGEQRERWIAQEKEADQHPSHLSWGAWLTRSSRRFQLRIARWYADRVLDRKLNTSGIVSEPEHVNPDHGRYVPSEWHVLPRALKYLGVSDRDTFVDFGCGKGRVLHQAARYPFRRVIGVEISPVLAETARRALAARRHQHRCGDVEVVLSDAAAYRVPDDLTIAYLYHPFENVTFDAVLSSIIGSIDRHPRRVRLIYVYPMLSERILATGRFRLVEEQPGRLTPLAEVQIFESL